MNAYAKIRARPGGLDGGLPLQDFLEANQDRLSGDGGVPWWMREYVRPEGVPEGKGWVQDGLDINSEGSPTYVIPPADKNPAPLFDRVKNVYGRIQGGPR